MYVNWFNFKKISYYFLHKIKDGYQCHRWGGVNIMEIYIFKYEFERNRPGAVPQSNELH